MTGRVSEPRRVMLLGATGTIGRATAAALVAAGHEVVCPVRRADAALPEGAEARLADPCQPERFARDALRGEGFDAVISTMASRSGAPADAWAVDHVAQLTALEAARAAGVGQFVLLSAICVQKPLLEFQRAKLAFEAALQASGLVWSIVRPTAFFKSLSGQVARVMAGKPFVVFGDGRGTACKPISDRDLAAYLLRCFDDPAMQNRVLSIGGPGPAITPRDQAAMLSELLGREVPIRRVPLALIDGIAAAAGLAGLVSARAAEKAALARIGRYYATESMLWLDPETGRYDAARTPEFGHDRLRDHYASIIAGDTAAGLGDHAVFGS